MLLGAAHQLAQICDFDGTVAPIFQPAEKGLGSARRMIAEGLFDRFPCDEICGMHNAFNSQPDTKELCKGAAMAGAAVFDTRITGVGAHAAQPHHSREAPLMAAAPVKELKTIHSSNLSSIAMLVLSVTQLHARTAYNVLPEAATLSGTIRCFKDDVYEMAAHRLREIAPALPSPMTSPPRSNCAMSLPFCPTIPSARTPI